MYYSSPREASLSMIKAAPSTGLLERFRRVLSSLLKPEKVPEDQVRVNPWWGAYSIFSLLEGVNYTAFSIAATNASSTSAATILSASDPSIAISSVGFGIPMNTSPPFS